MDFIQRLVHYFAVVRRQMRRHRRLVTTCAAVVVFVTAYALILPAITLDEQTAQDTPGVSIEQSAEEQAADETSADTAAAAADAAASEAAEAPAGDASSTAEPTAADTDSTLINTPTTLAAEGDGYHATADVDAGARLPQGVTLQVREITRDSDAAAYQKYYDASLASLQQSDPSATGLSNARFFDISFVDASGNEVEPSADVEVTVSYDQPVQVADAAAVDVVHFADDSTASLLADDKTTVDAPDNALSEVGFRSSDFSVYGIVEARGLEAKAITADGTGYTFKVEYDADSGIPEGSTLEVSEVSGPDYDSYVARTNELVYGQGSEGSVSFARYFDVRIVHDGQEVEPSKPVRVTVTADGTGAITGDVNVLHFVDGGEPETIPADRQADGSISYEQSSFSVVGLYQADATQLGEAHLMADGDQAADIGTPEHSKTLTDNNDGTYDLTLSVRGKGSSSSTSNKADVVVVFDTSGSMEYPTEYVSATGSYGYLMYTDSYGYSHSEYVPLYYRSSSGRWPNYYQVSDGYSGTVYYKSGNSYYEYTGPRYTQQTYNPTTRLSVAQSSINSLAQQLLSNNAAGSTAEDANVTLSLVTFSDTARTQITRTTSLTQFQSAINSTTADGGTNWEDALIKANDIDARDGATKYVIFVSDGNPTYYMGGYNNSQRQGTGYETDDNISDSYEGAKTQLDGRNANFYGVGVFGNVTRMQSLVTAAGSASDHYQSATDQASLNAAFENIIRSITNSADFRNVTLTDNLTALTSTALGNEAAPEAWRSATVKVTDASGQEVTTENLPEPTYNSKTKQIQWSLGEDYHLKDGYTYSVTFRVWPSQAAYDHVAALNNGTENWDDLSNDVKAQIVRTGDAAPYTYTLKTNTDSGNTVSYTRVDTTTQNGQTTTQETSGSVSFDNPGPITLANATVTVTKVWAPASVTPPSGEVTLSVMDGSTKVADVTLNQQNNWTSTVYVAPGLHSNDSTLESGHDYTVIETNQTANFTFSAGDASHPMLWNSATDVKGSDGKATSLTGTNTLVGLNVAIYKTDTGSTTTPLPGAEFKLYRQYDATTKTPSGQVTKDAAGASIGTDDNGHAVTTGPDGTIAVGRLATGTYYLVETKAPAGYQLLTDPIQVTVNGNGVTAMQGVVQRTVTPSGTGADATYTITVMNTTGTALPSTGGNGSLPFLLGGSALVTTAIVGFALRRKNEGRDGRI